MGLERFGCLNRRLRRWAVMGSRPRRASTGVEGGIENCLYCRVLSRSEGDDAPFDPP